MTVYSRCAGYLSADGVKPGGDSTLLWRASFPPISDRQTILASLRAFPPDEWEFERDGGVYSAFILTTFLSSRHNAGMESPATPSVASQFSLIIEGLLMAIVTYLEWLLETPAFQKRMAANPGMRAEMQALVRTLRSELPLALAEFRAAGAAQESPCDDAESGGAFPAIRAMCIGPNSRPSRAWPARDSDAAVATIFRLFWGGEIFSPGSVQGSFHAHFVA